MKTPVFSISVIFAVLLSACSDNGTFSDESKTIVEPAVEAVTQNLYTTVFNQVADAIAEKSDRIRAITATDGSDFEIPVMTIDDGREVSAVNHQGNEFILVWESSSPGVCCVNITPEDAFVLCKENSIPTPISQAKREEILKEIQFGLR